MSRAAAMEVLAALMAVTDPHGGSGLTRNEREARFMFGVLLVPGRRPLAAASGTSMPASMMAAVGLLPGFDLAGAVIHPVRGRGGALLDPGVIGRCKVTNEPLACAAPKLVDHANRNAYAMPYHMSELWFDPNASRRNLRRAPVFEREFQAGNINSFSDWLALRRTARVWTEHSDTRESCDTCKNVLPMLLCNAP